MKQLPHKKYEALAARYKKQIKDAEETWSEILDLSVECLSPELKKRAVCYRKDFYSSLDEFLKEQIRYSFTQQGQTYIKYLPENIKETLNKFLWWARNSKDSPCSGK